MKVLWPLARMSPAPTRVKIRSTRPIARLGGRHEAPHLGHDDDERDLADVGGLARHVGPGDDQKAVAAAVQVDVVGNEALGKGHPLHHGVSAVADLDCVAVVDGGAAVVVLLGHLGKGRPSRRDRPGPRRSSGCAGSGRRCARGSRRTARTPAPAASPRRGAPSARTP